jgi:outer membrane protein TolC
MGWAAVLLAVALIIAPALLSAQVSLSTVVDLAQRNSTAVRMAEADLQKANSLVAQSEDVFVPSLMVGTTAGYTHGFPTGEPSIANATMQSLVLSIPQRQYIRAAQAGVKAASLTLKDAREEAALAASTAYIELDTVQREIESSQQQQAFAERLVDIEQQRTEAGVDPLSDLLQTQLTAAQLKLKRFHLETRAVKLTKQLASLTGLPIGSVTPDRSSIPEIPALKAEQPSRISAGVESAQALARSKQLQSSGDNLAGRWPQIAFGATYNLDSDALNDYSHYYQHFTPNNVSFGVSIQFPLFDLGARAKAKQSAADALRAKVEAEQAEHQNDLAIAELTGSLRELNTLAEIASLKQQIAHEQLQSVLAQLELGNGATAGAGAAAQLTPKAEQLARIDERQKFEDSLEAGFDLSKARLSLLRSLGHMEDWLNELHGK